MRYIAAVALCLAIAAAGFPAQARAACAMDGGSQRQGARSADPQSAMPCHKSSDQKPAKDCCCQDMACGGGLSMDLPDDGGVAPRPDRGSRLAQVDDVPPIVNPTSTQERPPRSPA